MTDLIEKHELLLKLVAEQAEDEGIWFIAETAPEDYLQYQLRRLHRLIETGVYPID